MFLNIFSHNCRSHLACVIVYLQHFLFFSCDFAFSLASGLTCFLLLRDLLDTLGSNDSFTDTWVITIEWRISIYLSSRLMSEQSVPGRLCSTKGCIHYGQSPHFLQDLTDWFLLVAGLFGSVHLCKAMVGECNNPMSIYIHCHTITKEQLCTILATYSNSFRRYQWKYDVIRLMCIMRTVPYTTGFMFTHPTHH